MTSTPNSARSAISRRTPMLPAFSLLLRHPLFWFMLVIGAGLVLAAGELAGHHRLTMDERADRFYVHDGFYPLEQGGPTSTYRWTRPDAELTLPRTGPGPITVQLTMFDAAPVPRPLRVSLDGQEVYSGTTRVGGIPWVLPVSGTTAITTAILTINTAAWKPPGDSRTLGVALTGMEAQAPSAASRAYLSELGLLASVLVLVAAVAHRTRRYAAPLLAGTSVLCFWGGLMAYGDTWLSNAAPAIFLLGLVSAGIIVALPQGTPPAHHASLWGAAALVAAMLLITLGRFSTGDAEAMYQVSLGVVEDGIPWQHSNQLWAHFGLGQSLVTIPLYWLGFAWADLIQGDAGQFTRFCVSLLNQAVIPATALVLFLGAKRRYDAGVALAIAGTFLLATPAIPYARLAFSEPLSGLLILGAMMLLWSRTKEETPGLPSYLLLPASSLLGAGLCLGFAVLVKPANLIYLPATVLYLTWALARGGPGSLWSVDALRRVISGLILMALGLLPGLLLTVTYNAIRYGNPFTFGYENEGFTTPLYVGLYGLLFSPGKGIIFFAPPVLLGIVGLIYLWRSRQPLLRAETLWIAVTGIIVFVFNGLWSSWEGNIAWGPRLILPFVPFLLWPLGAIPLTRWTQGTWCVLGAIGFLAAIPGALVDQGYYFHLHGVFREGTVVEYNMLFTPSWSQLVAHWRFLLTGIREPVMRPTLNDMGLDAIWDTAVPVMLVALSLFFLVIAIAHNKPRRTPEDKG